MRGAFVVYAIAALVFAAGTGPAVQSLKDATLEDLAALKDPRPIRDFPFIETFQDHLPPVVVDWIIVDPATKVKVPPGARVEFDHDGDLIIIWPEGCSEEVNDRSNPTREECPEPPPPEPIVCPGDPAYNNSTLPPNSCPDPDLSCASGYHVEWDTTLGEYVCRLDPECQPDEDRELAPYCPRPEPPEPTCPEDQIIANDGTCLPESEHRLRATHHVEDPGSTNPSFHLKAEYSELRIQFRVQGQPSPTYTIRVERDDGTRICFQRDGQNVCEFTSTQLFDAGTYEARTDPEDAPFPAGAYRLRVTYERPPFGNGDDSLTVDLFGTAQR